jgi:DNA-binding beta-propeller fold protein YncE
VVVPGAHGLAAAGGRLYVSSLADGKIRELEQSNGSVARIAGGLGVSKGRYLWPVGLTADGGRVLVTDAHNGAITILNGDLQVQSRVGANGPGLDAFNFPFATLPVSGGYLIVDSFRYRLARTDRSWTLQDQLALGTAVPVGRQRPTVIGSDAQPNTYRMLPGVDLPAELGLRKRLAFVGGLNGLDHVTANGTVQHVDVVDPQFGSTSITWAQTVESYIVIGSCQGSTLEVIDPATGMFTFVTVGGDTWWRAGELLLSVNLRRTLSAAIAPAVTAFAQAKLLLARGVSRADAFNQALSAGRPRDWSRDLSSPAAQQFLHSAQTPDDAATFFAAALQQREPRAVELLEVKYLSGGQ